MSVGSRNRFSKVTLFEFTRNMMQQLEGDTFHVDISNDRGRSVDRLESAAACSGKNAAGQSADVGANEMGPVVQQPNEAVVWPKQHYVGLDSKAIIQPCSGCGRMLNVMVEGCFCRALKDEELKAEEAFFKARADILCNCKRVCRGANPGVKCRQGRKS
jgi:hypothetical protein